jgi:alpha-L-arabinofuranosidase
MTPPLPSRSGIVPSLLAFLLLLGAAAAGTGQPGPSARTLLTVHADRPGARISPNLYGIFFEEINHAGDGGLYGELVRNRSFEDAATPEGWSLVTRGGAEAKIALDADRPVNEGQRHSLRIEIRNAGDGQAGIANEGFWGIAVQEGAACRLSVYARRSREFRGALTASLEGASGEVYARKRLDGLTEDWKKLSCTLNPSETDPAARLVLTASSAGTLWLDMVSLFPEETWKGRANGLRADLGTMVQEMAPAFVRFPGGCFVEGDRIANAFRWKRTIGPLEARPGHDSGKWGYRSSDGLGYHEYLQWCEDLHAAPLFVVNCGMACQFSTGECVPLPNLEEWVQDALDAVEYANGPVTSRWGGLRARNGHPKPFGLKYLEVGNENGWGATLPQYEERYARFYDALKARYPEVRLIATTPVKGRPMDLVDEHFYQSADWFINNTGRYDAYPRNGAKVYVGEYAVTQGCGQGNLRAALGEAAFMTGLERNGDLVEMSSYAPLFVNVHNRTWNPDAIPYDSARSYGTPSYWVQRLFARNRGDVVLPLDLAGGAAPAPPPGGVGLGTWKTQAEFRDVRVTRGNETLLAPEFRDGADGWRPLHGEWKAENGVYRQTSPVVNVRSTAGDPHWTDYTYSLKARKLGGEEGFLIMFRVRDEANWYWWNIGGWNNTRHAIERTVDGGGSRVGSEVPGKIETGRWYDIRIELQGPRIRCYLDGKLVHDVEDQPVRVAAVASRAERSGELILKVVNVSPASQETRVRLEGAGKVRPTGRATVLTGKPEEENSLAEPERIAPVEATARDLGPEFDYAFPPHSVTILRLAAGR